jgi:hypothetical protein
MIGAKANVLILDVETTGLTKDVDQIIELACKKGLDAGSDLLVWRFNPTVSISLAAEQTHGIRMEDLALSMFPHQIPSTRTTGTHSFTGSPCSIAPTTRFLKSRPALMRNVMYCLAPPASSSVRREWPVRYPGVLSAAFIPELAGIGMTATAGVNWKISVKRSPERSAICSWVTNTPSPRDIRCVNPGGGPAGASSARSRMST